MTEMLAKIFGLYFLAVGTVFVSNPTRIREVYQLLMKQDSLLYALGVIALFFGAFVISAHNIWVMDWPVIITILGWLSFFKGFGLMMHAGFTRYFGFIVEKSDSFYRAIGLVQLLFGLFFLYHGWK